MSHLASGLSDSTSVNKRQRTVLFPEFPIDRDDSDPPVSAPVPSSTAPSAAAKAELEFLAETLPEELRPSVLKHGASIIKHYVAWQVKRAKLNSMEADKDFLPRSLRFKVKADLLPEVERSHPEYAAKKEEFEAAIIKAGHDLKPHILFFTNMNVSGLARRYHKAIAEALKVICELCLAYYNQENYGVHRFVASFLTQNKGYFEGTFKFSIKRFAIVYRELFDHELFPASEEPATDVAGDAAPEGTTAAPTVNKTTPAQAQRTDATNVTPFTTALAILNAAASPEEQVDTTMSETDDEPLLGSRVLVEKWVWSWIIGIHRVTEKYEEQKVISARNQRMKEASARLESTTHTSRVHDQLAAEANVEPPILKAMVQQELDKRDKKLGAAEERIKKLEKALKSDKAKKASASTPKNDKGAAKGGATAKKSTPPSTPNQSKKGGQKAAGADNDTQGGASQRGKSRSSNRRQRRRSKSRGPRRNSSGASRRN